MEKELNIAEILKDKPKGLKLWSDTFGELIVDCIDEQNDAFPIYLKVRHGNNICLTKDGCYYSDEAGTLPCIVPSKSMRDWSKFAWKKGDVLFSNNTLVVFNRFVNDDYTDFEAAFEGYQNETYDEGNIFYTDDFSKATDDGAKDFIKNIEGHYGGKLNLETLEIEKPKQEFKDGDIVTHEENNHIYILEKWDSIMDRIFYHASLDTHSSIGLDTYCGSHHLEYPVIRLATDSEKQLLFAALAKENKAWDAEKKKIVDLPKKCGFKPKDWCLMRDYFDDSLWDLCQFAFKDDNGFYHSVNGGIWRDCIPYNDKTAHLLGTNGDYEEGGE